jgi:hypothetical protein
MHLIPIEDVLRAARDAKTGPNVFVKIGMPEAILKVLIPQSRPMMRVTMQGEGAFLEEFEIVVDERWSHVLLLVDDFSRATLTMTATTTERAQISPESNPSQE